MLAALSISEKSCLQSFLSLACSYLLLYAISQWLPSIFCWTERILWPIIMLELLLLKFEVFINFDVERILMIPISIKIEFHIAELSIELVAINTKNRIQALLSQFIWDAFWAAFIHGFVVLCHEYALRWLNFLRFFDAHRIC